MINFKFPDDIDLRNCVVYELEKDLTEILKYLPTEKLNEFKHKYRQEIS